MMDPMSQVSPFNSSTSDSHELLEPTYYIIFQFVMQRHERYIFIIVLCLIMCVTLFLFVCYHLWLISQGLTTNEKFRKTNAINHYENQVKLCQLTLDSL